MLTILSLVLFVGAGLGVIALAVQLVATHLYMRKGPYQGESKLGISVLKPLCGVDDDLPGNLETFARLEYEHYEVVLGVKDRKDPAYAVALEAAARWPGKFRVVIQRGEPGLNPKVNQLITLSKAAKHEILLISDSNIKVLPRYLNEVAAIFENPEVACVTHPIAGTGHKTVGSILDNLHLASSAGAGMVASKTVAGQDIVVGKSMALRREDLKKMGGFEVAKDYLAEDYVIGRFVSDVLGKKVVVARTPVFNVSERRTLDGFFNRYRRWSVIHRTAVAPITFAAQTLLNPWPISVIAFALNPTGWGAVASAAILVAKAVVDIGANVVFTNRSMGLKAFLLVPLKDVLLFITHMNAVFSNTVVWRGNKLRVQAGSKLVVPGHLAAAHKAPHLEPAIDEEVVDEPVFARTGT